MTRVLVPFALLSGLLLLVGCTAPANNAKKGGADAQASKDAKKKEPHEHPEEGPHGGPLAELADGTYHAEFTVDHKTKRATVYILDVTARKSSPLDAKEITLTLTNVKPSVQVALKAEPQKDDPAGKASCYAGSHEAFGKEMDFQGEIRVLINGEPHEGEFNEKEHDHKKKK